MTLAARRDLLTAVLDTLVPAGDGFPAAGAVALDHVLGVADASADLESLLVRGLQAVGEHAQGVGGFAALDPDAREHVLRRVEGEHTEFFDALVRHTYDGYYTHPTIIARLGLDPGPVQPRGHRPEPVEMPGLARVTARGALYRRA